ncbi:hypothetical protein D3C84_819170 [compost metagenome]
MIPANIIGRINGHSSITGIDGIIFIGRVKPLTASTTVLVYWITSPNRPASAVGVGWVACRNILLAIYQIDIVLLITAE